MTKYYWKCHTKFYESEKRYRSLSLCVSEAEVASGLHNDIVEVIRLEPGEPEKVIKSIDKGET